MKLLKLMRLFNKVIKATLSERIMIQKLFGDKRCYNYLEIPDSCFKSKGTSIIKL